MLVGCAMVNALAFSGSNYLFSMFRSSDLNEERKRHDQAVEQLQAAQTKWSQKRTERLDWISLRTSVVRGTPSRPFELSTTQYANTRGSLDALGPELKLSDFYVPSSGQRDREIAFVVLGISATSLVAYKLAK